MSYEVFSHHRTVRAGKAPAAVQAAVQAAVAPLLGAYRAVRVRLRERAALKVLLSLDDATLIDIGIPPSQIRHLARLAAENPGLDQHHLMGRR